MKYRRQLLIATRNDTKGRYFKYVKEVCRLKEAIKDKLSEEHYNTIINVTESSREKKFIKTKDKLKNKFELLYASKYKTTSNKVAKEEHLVKNCVLNLADSEIPQNHLDLLNLGPNFAVTPRNIPYMDIITTTEIEALKLEKKNQLASAELLRQEVKEILYTAKQPRSNLSQQQQLAIKEIKSDPLIDIYSYDKGNGFVRLTKEQSKEKMKESIGTTKILKSDPTNTHVKKIQDLLRSIAKQINIPKQLYYKLYPSDAIPPRAYGQCKAHKATKNYPFRILVSTIGTAPYKLSEYLVKIIQPTLGKSNVVIKNSKAFVEEAKHWSIQPEEIQVSYDVVALYPSVPVQKAINNLMDILKDDIEDLKTRTVFQLKHIKQLIEVCLYKAYFLYDNQIHCLEDSGPIGLSLMVVLAESFLQTIEKKAINIAINLPIPVNPITHKRYVDDTHDRFTKKEQSEEFLRILNDQEPRIKFEAEYENENNELNYLDIKVVNTKHGKYDFKIHRKEAITNVQIKPESCHDDKIKYGIFKGFISRAKSICSPKYVKEEIRFLTNVFVENGYDRTRLEKIVKGASKTRTNQTPRDTTFTSLPWIPGLSQKLKKSFKKIGCQIVFKSPKNLNSILTFRNKPQLPPNSHPGVYFVPTGCKSGYTGETKKRISTRNTEHEKAVFKGDMDDALAEHKEKCNCEIEWKNTETIAIETNYFRRKVRESLEIRRLKTGPKDKNGANRDYGDYVKTETWRTLFENITPPPPQKKKDHTQTINNS